MHKAIRHVYINIWCAVGTVQKQVARQLAMIAVGLYMLLCLQFINLVVH